MKKRAIWIAVSALLLIASLALCLAACNDESTNQPGISGPGDDQQDPGGEKPEEPAEWVFEQPGGMLGYELIAYNGTESEVSVPAEYEGKSVVSIRGGAFKNAAVVSVTIPDTVTTIKAEAFSDCATLAEVVYEGTLTQWYDNVFKYDDWYGGAVFESVTCSDGKFNVAEMNFSRGVGFRLTDDKSGYEVFSLSFSYSPANEDGTRGVEHVIIPAVYKGKPVVEISELVAEYLNPNPDPRLMVKSVTVTGNNLKKISDDAFNGWTALEKVVLPDSVESIGEYAFNSTSGLKEINFPESLTQIGANAFAQSGLKEINNLPKCLAEIGREAFGNCSALQSVDLQDTQITVLNSSLFNNCTALRFVSLGAALTKIGINVFRSCSALNEISFAGTVNQWNEVELYTSVENMAWNAECPVAKVVCSDGEVAISA